MTMESRIKAFIDAHIDEMPKLRAMYEKCQCFIDEVMDMKDGYHFTRKYLGGGAWQVLIVFEEDKCDFGCELARKMEGIGIVTRCEDNEDDISILDFTDRIEDVMWEFIYDYWRSKRHR